MWTSSAAYSVGTLRTPMNCPTQESLADHQRIQHTMAKCARCGKVFTRETSRRLHTRTCGYGISKQQALDREPLPCPVCRNSFPKGAKFNIHVRLCKARVLREEKKQDLKCHKCQREFSSDKVRVRRQTNCQGGDFSAETMENKTCDKCHKIFKSKALREEHGECDRVRKRAGSIENRTCSRCRKVFPRTWSCQRHMKRCEGGLSLVTSHQPAADRTSFQASS